MKIGPLYPNSIDQGADVYSATSDANGYWAMNVKTNATGVTGYVTMNGFNGTQDTIINGVTKTGLFANYFGNTPGNTTFFMGTTYDFFGKEAHHTYTAHSKKVQENRTLLKSLMEEAGFNSIRTEWWHYSINGGDYLDLSSRLWKCN